MGVVARINGGARRIPAWPLYLLAVLPPAWLLWAGITGQLGVDPTKVLEHQMGEWALQLLLLGLVITPLRDLTGIQLVKYRRAIGVIAFAYVFLHLLVWLVLDLQLLWAEIWKDIVKRPYITIGMLSFVLLLPLAVTSNNLSIRKMGPLAWRKLHKLAYAACLLGGLHFVLLAKGWQLEPLLYLGAAIVLVGWRLRPVFGRVWQEGRA